MSKKVYAVVSQSIGEHENMYDVRGVYAKREDAKYRLQCERKDMIDYWDERGLEYDMVDEDGDFQIYDPYSVDTDRIYIEETEYHE